VLSRAGASAGENARKIIKLCELGVPGGLILQDCRHHGDFAKALAESRNTQVKDEGKSAKYCNERDG